MSTHRFPVVFRRQLRFWTFHCMVNAAPSFAIALMILGLRRSPSGIAAMGCGVATYIVLYSCLTSFVGSLSLQETIFAKSLKTGAKIRSLLAAIAFVTFNINIGLTKTNVGSHVEKAVSLGYVTDLFCGIAATRHLDSLVSIIKPLALQFSLGAGPIGFLKIYLITLVQGFILSVLLLIISVVAAILRQTRERRRLFARAGHK